MTTSADPTFNIRHAFVDAQGNDSFCIEARTDNHIVGTLGFALVKNQIYRHLKPPYVNLDSINIVPKYRKVLHPEDSAHTSLNYGSKILRYFLTHIAEKHKDFPVIYLNAVPYSEEVYQIIINYPQFVNFEKIRQVINIPDEEQIQLKHVESMSLWDQELSGCFSAMKIFEAKRKSLKKWYEKHGFKTYRMNNTAIHMKRPNA
jgi:hypothetical protein